MTTEVAIDNDVLIKCSCYNLLDELTSISGGTGTERILGLAKYVVRDQLHRRNEIRDRDAAKDCFEAFLKRAEELEPTEDEVDLASRIEEGALLQGLNMDEGESQLCAIAITRTFRLLVTGDKRAIVALEELLNSVAELQGLENRLACLEQMTLCVLERLGKSETRTRVCSEPDMDKALSVCFSCSQAEEPPGFDASGLHSYIEDLRAKAPTVLCTNESVEAA